MFPQSSVPLIMLFTVRARTGRVRVVRFTSFRSECKPGIFQPRLSVYYNRGIRSYPYCELTARNWERRLAADIKTTVSTWVEAHIQILMPLSTFMETYPPEYHVQGNMSTGFYVQGNMSTGLHVRGNISTSWIVSIGSPLFCSAKEPE